MKDRYHNLIFISIIMLLFFLSGCATLATKTVNCNYTGSSFWFSLDPLVLTKESNHKITTLTSGNKKFDQLFLKSQILVNSLTSNTATKHYTDNQICNEITMTLSMIDSIDPISTFSGNAISIADPAYKALLKQKEMLTTLLKNFN